MRGFILEKLLEKGFALVLKESWKKMSEVSGSTAQVEMTLYIHNRANVPYAVAYGLAVQSHLKLVKEENDKVFFFIFFFYFYCKFVCLVFYMVRVVL